MHFVIVDDLSSDQKRLKKLIKQDCSAHGITADFSLFESGEAFLEKYRSGFCDALFLDIMLGGISGIATAKAVRQNEPNLPIIFTTTEPDFALDGFSLHAMDYLVKPLVPGKVAWCLEQLREHLSVPSFITLRIIDGPSHAVQRTIQLNEIQYGQYQNRSLSISTLSGDIRTTLSFQEFLSLLPQTGRFYVCGRGVMVNLSQVERIEDGVILLQNGERILFSRRNTAEVRKAFAAYQFACCRKGRWS